MADITMGGTEITHGLQFRGGPDGTITAYCRKPECHMRLILAADHDLTSLTEIERDHCLESGQTVTIPGELVNLVASPETTFRLAEPLIVEGMGQRWTISHVTIGEIEEQS
jgi:hypothetical protein